MTVSAQESTRQELVEQTFSDAWQTEGVCLGPSQAVHVERKFEKIKVK